MRVFVTGKQMKAIDQTTIQKIGIPSLVLMERAAMAVAEEIQKRTEKTDKICCACGCGNNGADGAAAARMLHLAGYPVTVVYIGDRKKGSEEFQTQISIAENLGIRIMEEQEFIPEKYDVLVDAVFGVGLSRPVEGRYEKFLERLKETDAGLTVAVDIPSGISSDSGQILGTALKADITVTFGWEKLGTVFYPGKSYAGEVILADIGFPPAAFYPEERFAFTYDKKDIKTRLKRPAYSNKGTYGKVLVAAGCRMMGGAAYLSASAAYRAGAGLVKILTVEENRIFLQTRLPEAILEIYDAQDLENHPESHSRQIKEACEWADAVVLGPGLGQEPYAKILTEQILAMACTPVVVDADGLNLIAANPCLCEYFTENIIITPHLGEMARLTEKSINAIQKTLIETAADYASRYKITCVLKDAVTVAALRDGRIYVNSSGNSAMAKGGSGDVLTGVIAGFLAQGLDKAEAAALGVYVHGLAGNRYREQKGAYGLLAGELADLVGEVLQQAETKKENSNGKLSSCICRD